MRRHSSRGFYQINSVLRAPKANSAAKPFCGKSAYANNEEQMQASDAMLRKYVHTLAPLVTSLALLWLILRD